MSSSINKRYSTYKAQTINDMQGQLRELGFTDEGITAMLEMVEAIIDGTKELHNDTD